MRISSRLFIYIQKKLIVPERTLIMIKKMEIFNFRSFQHIIIENLSPITIIGGKNNSGKSAVLEAAMLSNVLFSPDYFKFFSAVRNAGDQIFSPNQIWNPLFYRMENTDELEIKYEHAEEKTSIKFSKVYIDRMKSSNMGTAPMIRKFNDNSFKKNFTLHMKYTNKEQTISGEYAIQRDMMNNNIINFKSDAEIFFPIASLENIYYYKQPSYLSRLPEWISQISLDDEKMNLLITALQKFDKNIIDIAPISDNNISFVYVKFNSGDIIPINYLGDGINRAISLLLCVLNFSNGILLIDEIENGLYFKLYDEILPILCETALSTNCQIIMTTHNRDIIKTVVNSMEKLKRIDDVCYQRMSFSKGSRKTFAFSGEDIISSFASNMEMR